MTPNLPNPRSPIPDPHNLPTPHTLHPTLIDLSDSEQEGLSGGFRRGGFDQLFFQHTEIDSVGEEQTQAGNGNSGLRISSLARSGYSFRQTTLSFLSSSLGRGGRGNPWLMLFSLFRNLLA